MAEIDNRAIHCGSCRQHETVAELRAERDEAVAEAGLAQRSEARAITELEIERGLSRERYADACRFEDRALAAEGERDVRRGALADAWQKGWHAGFDEGEALATGKAHPATANPFEGPAEVCADPQHVANPEHHYCQPPNGARRG